MRIIIVIFILFNIHSMHIDLSHINGHDNDIIPNGMDVEHIVVANNIMEYYKNKSLENIVQEIDGIVYTEEWQNINGFGIYDNYYQVSTFGRVKALSRVIVSKEHYFIRNNKKYFKPEVSKFYKEKILTSILNHDGYCRIGLQVDRKHKCYFVHVLVAKTFIPNPENLKEVNHKNGIKHDSFINQLEWISPSNNQKHAYALGLRKPNGKRNKVKI